VQWNGITYVGTDAGIYYLDGETYTDDYPLTGTVLERRFVTPPIFTGDDYARMASVELNAVAGVGLAAALRAVWELGQNHKEAGPWDRRGPAR